MKLVEFDLFTLGKRAGSAKAVFRLRLRIVVSLA